MSPILEPSAMYARCQRRSIRTDTLSSGRPTGAQGFLSSKLRPRMSGQRSSTERAVCSAAASMSLYVCSFRYAVTNSQTSP